MGRRLPRKELDAIKAIIASHPGGIGIQGIQDQFDQSISRNALLYRLQHLIREGQVFQEGTKRWTKYRADGLGTRHPSTRTHPSAATQRIAVHRVRAHGAKRESKPAQRARAARIGDDLRESSQKEKSGPPLSPRSAEIQEYLRQDAEARNPVAYNRGFLDAYIPNRTAYLSEEDRTQLHKAGTFLNEEQPAGSLAKQILSRILIDLSWNSSRLEGNTYSRLDTKRLIHFGTASKGKTRINAQMILNHKDAIKFLVDHAEETDFNHRTVLNLHALLSHNLLGDPSAEGQLRRIPMEIGKSAYQPLVIPQLIDECFRQILDTARVIDDPFERAFFAMVHLPYLQPFLDVNKRVSRLAANIPLIRANLAPLSFVNVPPKIYTEAMLGVYELNKVDLLRDVFLWAYERSSKQYRVDRSKFGKPDPFRFRYRDALQDIVRAIVTERLDRKAACAYIADWAKTHVKAHARIRFRETAEDEVLALSEGNHARYRVSFEQFEAWRNVWDVHESGETMTKGRQENLHL